MRVTCLHTSLALLLLSTPAWSQAEAAKSGAREEDHQPSIHGIRIGMTTPEVVERLGGRMPDQRKDEKDEIIVYWKLEGGNVLQVNFRQENYVSHIGLQYKPPRPTNDFWLVRQRDSTYAEMTSPDRPSPVQAPELGTPPGVVPSGPEAVVKHEVRDKAPRMSRTGSGELDSRDPRWRIDYKVSETEDRERTVWVKQLDAASGYRVEIKFLSAHKKRLGERYESEVDFKYVSVNRNDLKKFDQAVAGKK